MAAPKINDWPGNPSMTVSARLKNLRKQNRDVIGWLSIPDTLEQAVVQRDNTYYLKRDYRGYHNANGALFLEEGISLAARLDTYKRSSTIIISSPRPKGIWRAFI